MAESIVQVTEGVGKKLHTWSYVVGANTVEDEVVVPGPYPWPTYTVVAGGISGAVSNDHLLCLNSGAALKVRVHRIRIRQASLVAAAALRTFSILRTTTTLPTGGTGPLTPAAHDTADTAGAVGRSVPAVKGTESTTILLAELALAQAISATQQGPLDVWEWRQAPNGKPIIIPAGTTNGLVIKNIAAATVTYDLEIEFSETAF